MIGRCLAELDAESSETSLMNEHVSREWKDLDYGPLLFEKPKAERYDLSIPQLEAIGSGPENILSLKLMPE